MENIGADPAVLRTPAGAASLRYRVGLMIVAFAVCGFALMALIARELVQRAAARRRLLRTEGAVVDVVRKTAPRSPGQVRWRPYSMFFPIVTFTPEGGMPVEFQSEVGEGGQASRYRPGQRLAVWYDPDGKTPPMLDAWSGPWLPPLVGMFAGLVFLAGSAMVAWALFPVGP